MFAISAEAGEVSRSVSNDFSHAWERYASGDGGRAQLTYGYNTTFIDEDYAWAKHSEKSHYAAVYNGNGWHTGSGAKPGRTSRVDVTHGGDYVLYKNNF